MAVILDLIIISLQVIAILMLSLILDESVCQRGRAGGRRLRNRQRQGRLFAGQGPLGPPPQHDVRLTAAEPIFLANAAPIPIQARPSPRQNQQFVPRQQFRVGRQFAIDGEGGSLQGTLADEEGNYNFQ